MRKRKSPIVLVTALAVVVAGVAGFQFASSRPGGNAADIPPAPEIPEGKQVGESRPSVSTQQTSQGIKGVLNSSSPRPSAPPEAMGGPGGPQNGPMILNSASQSGKPEKPKPNPSSTSAQWYNNESAMSKDKG